MSIKVTDKEFWLDNYTKSNLDHLKEAVHNKWDGWLLYTGIEGVGKTTVCASHAYYLGYDEKTNKSNFNLDCIVWTVDQFVKAITTAEPYTVILWDEAVFGLLSTEAMTEIQRTLMKYATTIRKKKLFVMLIIPYIWMLSKYFVSRCRGMFNIVTPDGLSRGDFKFYNRQQMLYLYAEGKKHWFIPNKCGFSFKGNSLIKSIDKLGLNEQEYEDRKDKAILSLYTDKKKEDNKYLDRFYKLVGYIKEKDNFKWKDLPDLTGLDMTYNALQRGYSRYIERQMDKEHDFLQMKTPTFKMPDVIK